MAEEQKKGKNWGAMVTTPQNGGGVFLPGITGNSGVQEQKKDVVLPGITTKYPSTVTESVNNEKSNVVLPGITNYTNTTIKSPEEGLVDYERRLDEQYEGQTIPLIKGALKEGWNNVKKFGNMVINNAITSGMDQASDRYLADNELFGKDVSKEVEEYKKDIAKSKKWKNEYIKIKNEEMDKWRKENLNQYAREDFASKNVLEMIRKRDWRGLKYGVTEMGAQSLGMMLPTIIVGAVTRDPTVMGGVGFMSAYPHLYQEVYEEGMAYGLTSEQAELGATLVGSIGSILEVFGFEKVFGKFFTASKGGYKPLLKIFADTLKDLGEGAGAEALTEASQEFLKNLYIHLYNEEKDVMEGVVESGTYGGILGLIFGGATSPINVAGEYSHSKEVERQADLEALDYVMEAEQRKARRARWLERRNESRKGAKSWGEVNERDSKFQAQGNNSGNGNRNDYSSGRNIGGAIGKNQSPDDINVSDNVESNGEAYSPVTDSTFFSTDANGDYIDYNGRKIYAGSKAGTKDQFTQLSDNTKYNPKYDKYFNNFQRLVQKLSDKNVSKKYSEVVGHTQTGKEIRMSKEVLRHIFESHGKFNIHTLLEAINNPSGQKWESELTGNNKNKRPYILLDLPGTNKTIVVALKPNNGSSNTQNADFYYVASARESNAPTTQADNVVFQENGEENTPGVASAKEKTISAIESLSIEDFLQGQTVEQFAEKYGIPVHIVKQILTPKGKKAYGAYGNGFIRLAELIKESTAPHELLHAVFDMIDPETRVLLISNIMKSEGLSAPKAEEWLADSFSNFFRTGKIEKAPKSTWGHIKKFFKRVRTFINGMDKYHTQIEKMFRDILEANGIEELQSRIDEDKSLNRSKEKMRERFEKYKERGEKRRNRRSNEDKYQEVDDDKMVALHNISLEKLSKAGDLGGLVAPSVAITKGGIPFENYGEISFIANKELINPSDEVLVGETDLYTPRVPTPTLEWKDGVTREQQEKIAEKLGMKMGELYDYVTGYSQNHWERMYPNLAKEIAPYIEKTLFKGFTEMGDRIYEPYTMDNILKDMFEEGDVGSESALFQGNLSEAMARISDMVEDLEDVRGKIYTREGLDKEYDALSDKYTDLGWDILEGREGMAIFSENIREDNDVIVSELADYGIEVTEEQIQELKDIVMEALRLPKSYVEAKMKRGVGFDEFSAVVVPEDKVSEVKEIVGDNIEIYGYKPGERMDVINSVADNKGLKFQEVEYDYDEEGNRTNIKFPEDNNEFDPSIFGEPTREEQMAEDKENLKDNPYYDAWIKYNNQNYKDDQLTFDEFMEGVMAWSEKEQDIYDKKMKDLNEAQNDPKMLELQLKAVKLLEEEQNVGKKFGKNVSKEVRDRQQAEVEKKREDLTKEIYEWMYPGLSFEEATYDDMKSADEKEADWELLGKENIEEKLKYFKKDKNGNWEAKNIKIESPQEKRDKIVKSGRFDEVFEQLDRVIEWKTPEGQRGRLDSKKDLAKYKKTMEKINAGNTKTKVTLKDVTVEQRALEKTKAMEEEEKARKKKEREEAFAKKKQDEYKKIVIMKAFQKLVDMQRFEKYPFLTEEEIKNRYGFSNEEWKKITEQEEIKVPKKWGEKAISDLNKAVDSKVRDLIEGLSWQNNMKRKDAEKDLGEIGEIDLDVLLGRDEEKGQREVEEFERVANEEMEGAKEDMKKRMNEARENVMDVEIDKERENDKSEKERLNKIIKSSKSDQTVWGSIKEFASDIAQPVSTRIKNISSKVYRELMRYFQNKDAKTNERLKAVDPFLKALGKMRKENPVRFMDVWVALANRNLGYANGLLKEYGVTVPTELLDTIYDEAQDVGLNINYLGSYFPMSVKAPRSFLEELMKVDKGDIASEIEKRIAEEATRKGGPLEEAEVTAIINSVIAGEEKGPDINIGNKHLKERNTDIKWTPEMLEYCDDPISTLIGYIEGMTQSIEKAKFLGKSRSGNVHTLADYVYSAKNEIDPEQQDELMDLLQSVFNDKSPNKFVQTWRDLGTLTTLGSPSSTLTQLSDLSFSVIENGWRETLKSVWDVWMKREAFDLKEMGVVNRGEEYTNINSQKNILQKAIHYVFNYGNFFSQFDTFGKSTFIQSTWRKRQKRARKGEKGDAQLRKDIMKWTDDEYMTDKVINDMKNGVFSQEVALVMYMKLGNIQPLTKAQMPKKYLDNPNGRLFYQFKTFGIKQLDYVLQETKNNMKGFKDMSTGEKMMKMAQIANMVFVMTLLGVGADELKDISMRRKSNSLILRWLFGENVGTEQVWDKIEDNVLKLFGLSRYTVMQMKSDPVEAITSLFTTLPATNLINYPFKDIYKAFKNDGSINWRNPSAYQLIPVIGKYWYWIYGGGQDKQQQALEKEKKSTSSGGSSRSTRNSRSSSRSSSRSRSRNRRN